MEKKLLKIFKIKKLTMQNINVFFKDFENLNLLYLLWFLRLK